MEIERTLSDVFGNPKCGYPGVGAEVRRVLIEGGMLLIGGIHGGLH